MLQAKVRDTRNAQSNTPSVDSTARLSIKIDSIMIQSVPSEIFPLNLVAGPIKCYYCFGEADNSSCADPVNPRKDKGSLEVIECEHGICLKWTSYWHSKF